MRNRLPPFAAALVPLAAALLPLAGCGGPVAPAWPHAPVQLVVDGLGITHVLAGSDADAFYGSGYAMARDRLFQMEYNRRRARGTLAELFGKALLASDEQARVVGFARLGVADMQRMRAESPDDAQLFDAWAAGINARLAELRAGKAPPEPTFAKAGWTFVPDDWTAEDGAAVGKLLAFGLSNTLQNDLLATLAMNTAAAVVKDLPLTMPAYDTFIVPWPAKGGGPNPMSLPVTDGSEGPAQGGGSREPVHAPPVGAWGLFGDVYASNNWAVDGAHSANGRPLLAGDPHQNLTSPVNFWPVHLDSTDGGGTLDVVGFAFVGTPTVELGHNAHVAWTA
ncbi:MAG TPA: penicillin acylase family protein, partial [Acidimicrobiales bacterium]|nr:penicillin acylase family protein [Acidimicrobiales bacterium]